MRRGREEERDGEKREGEGGDGRRVEKVNYERGMREEKERVESREGGERRV